MDLKDKIRLLELEIEVLKQRIKMLEEQPKIYYPVYVPYTPIYPAYPQWTITTTSAPDITFSDVGC